MKKVYKATEARKNFFNILDNVIHDGEVVYITKGNSNKMIKIETVDKNKVGLSNLAGVISDKDATEISKTIKSARKKSKPRKILPL